MKRMLALTLGLTAPDNERIMTPEIMQGFLAVLQPAS